MTPERETVDLACGAESTRPRPTRTPDRIARAVGTRRAYHPGAEERQSTRQATGFKTLRTLTTSSPRNDPKDNPTPCSGRAVELPGPIGRAGEHEDKWREHAESERPEEISSIPEQVATVDHPGGQKHRWPEEHGTQLGKYRQPETDDQADRSTIQTRERTARGAGRDSTATKQHASTSTITCRSAYIRKRPPQRTLNGSTAMRNAASTAVQLETPIIRVRR